MHCPAAELQCILLCRQIQKRGLIGPLEPPEVVCTKLIAAYENKTI